jgi:uncharacterized protein YciW
VLATILREEGWRNAPLSEREFVMMAHVETLTLAPSSIQASDLEALRAVGLDDTGILQLTAIAAYFAYLNRMADGLGVGR